MDNILLIIGGSGTNAEVLKQRFKKKKDIDIVLIDNVITMKQYAQNHKGVVIIALAGFKQYIPKSIWSKNIVINMHPGELPFTKGMYGDSVIWKMYLSRYEKGAMVIWHDVTGDIDGGDVIALVHEKVKSNITFDEYKEIVKSIEHNNYYKVIGSVIDEVNRRRLMRGLRKD